MSNELQQKFINDFIVDERWRFITGGLKVTFLVTLLSLVVGLILGAAIAVIRTAHDQLHEEQQEGAGKVLLSLGNTICRVYLTIIRGTPTLVQLLIMYYVILTSPTISKVTVAVVCFGINSGAYVAEIFRSGIMSVDAGQMEAGRSLGLSYFQTMTRIIMPQAIKNCLPSLVNECITLLKETSICGYIGLNELTRGGDIIRGTTFDALLPLFVVALIYLVIVMFFTRIMGIMERRLRESDVR